jgi:hypothetical protein
MSTMMSHTVKEEYLALVRAFPLLSIRDDVMMNISMKRWR